jgi:DNA replication protein DnaC
VLKKYLKPELLIIDDMGMKQLPRRSGECLFEVVMRRYETRSTMMTSNRPLEDWGKLLVQVSHISQGSFAYTLMPDSPTSRRPKAGVQEASG